jgi:hypothetical protein
LGRTGASFDKTWRLWPDAVDEVAQQASKASGRTMTGWLHCVFIACWVGGVISLCVAAVAFIRITIELRRAVRNGEAEGVPSVPNGLPLAVILTKNSLPRVEAYRRTLVWAAMAVVFLWALWMALVVAFSRNHH